MTPQQARSMLWDTFYAGCALWAVLFVAELIKPGFASNYISLPGFAALIFVLAVVVLASQPEAEAATPPAGGRGEPWYVYAGFAAVVVAAVSVAGLPLWLTLAMSFVTLMAFWAATTNETL